jgi:predicted dehydrogenase
VTEGARPEASVPEPSVPEATAPELGVAVVGFGWMGQVHTRAWVRLLQHYPDSPRRPFLVAAADPDEGRREQARTAYGYRHTYAAWPELLERDDIDVVSVCGPNFVHRDIGSAVAESGRHLWIEKPAGRGLADTSAIAESVRKAGVMSAVGFNYRNAPAVVSARELVAAGRIGDVETVTVTLLADYSAHPDGALSWRFDPQLAGTGVLGDLASHGFDLALHVAGRQTGPITELVSDQATFIPDRPEVTGAVSHFARGGGGPRGRVANEDRVSALLRFESGARGYLEASRVAVGEQCAYGFEIRGTKGGVIWDFRRMGELRVCADQDYQDAGWQTRYVRPGDGELAAFQPGSGVAMGYDDLKVIEARRLVESIATGTPVGATIEDAVTAARLVEAMVQSFEERRWVNL